MSSRTNRNTYFDFIRGIAIIMVIGIHTFTPATAGESEIPGLISNIVRQTLNCAVPLFLAISGYFISSKWESHVTPRGGIAGQISKVYIPTLIFSLPYLFQNLLYADSFKLIIIDVVTLLVCGYGVFYFIALIIQYYLLTPLLTRIGSRKLIWTSAAISALSILAISYLLYVRRFNLPLILYAGPCTLWIVFYSLGIYIRRANRQYSYAAALVIMIAGLVLSVVESYQWARFGNIVYGIKLSSFIFSAGAILVLLSERSEKRFRTNRLNRVIVHIGNLSFGIYLIHLMLITMSGINHYGFWVVRWLIILILSAVLIKLLNLFIPDRYHRLLGIV